MSLVKESVYFIYSLMTRWVNVRAQSDGNKTEEDLMQTPDVVQSAVSYTKPNPSLPSVIAIRSERSKSSKES